MRCVAHISDLHFGTEDPNITAGLLRDLSELGPSLCLVTGDLTQRARASQFRAAREFLDEIAAPKVIVPGNHDVPLFDLFRRFLFPLRRYQRFINAELNPCYEDRELNVTGINTARSLTWKSGRISRQQIDWLQKRLRNRASDKFKIVMTHHPFIPPAGDEHSGLDLVGRAAIALPVLDSCGVDLLLAGHLHLGYSGDIRTYYPASGRSIIVAQAGTAISRRVRSEPNAYNLLTLARDTIHIDIRVWDRSSFRAQNQTRYKLHGKEWRRE
jgi:3',5'-cyclic AMP phosphodiesterase CpdA